MKIAYPLPREHREAAVAAYECPFCHAAPGSWCPAVSSGRKQWWYVHIPRMRLFYEDHPDLLGA